jgi:alpha-beta hydrolase superfamily lysophospholipase
MPPRPTGAPIRRCETNVDLVDGVRALRRAWLPPEPERALLVVHGLAEHSGRYERFGAWFARRGCAVHAYDQRGHGLSSGRRGHVRAFDEFLDDLERVLRRVREEHPELPIALVGHSMGGLVVASFVCERRPEVAAAVTSGAALAVSDRISIARRLGARLVRRVVPRAAFPIGIEPSQLSRDPEVGERYTRDPLVFDRITVTLATELMRAVERTAETGGAAVRVPMLLLHGAEDTLCSPSGSRDFRIAIDVAGSEVRIYPGLRHEIFNEPEQERVFQDILDWLPRVGQMVSGTRRTG